jgi:hypothetical protein
MMLFPGMQVSLAGALTVVAALVFNKLIKPNQAATV